MLELNITDGAICLKTLDRTTLSDVAGFYGCTGDYQYATGMDSPVSFEDLAVKLAKLEADKKEFIAGIYLVDGNGTEGVRSVRAGAVSGIVTDNIVWIKLLAVLSEYRSSGIGTRTVALLLRYCRICFGASEAYLSVLKMNEGGVRFWYKQGFAEAGRIFKELYGERRPYEIIIMKKTL